MADPDRFLRFGTPGAQEWWYFDAISDDGRDVLVIVWYAGLPFDPAYGMAALRHVKDPARHPAPNALDHCAIGFQWYRDRRAVAYALNAYREKDFRHDPGGVSVEVAGSRFVRDADGYRLAVATPSVDGRTPIRTSLRFRPAAGTAPVERNLGTPAVPHLWILAAADCRVEGEVAVGDRPPMMFAGRGYHDHNAGSEEISLAMKRWRWGRVHEGPITHVYYHAEPRSGPESSVWVTLRDGAPARFREGVVFEEVGRAGNVFGVRHGAGVRITDGSERLVQLREHPYVDDGPFYRRWVGLTTAAGTDGSDVQGEGIGELLDTRNLNRRLYNWMIPYRLKRPSGN